MITATLYGGLGNQMFIYATVKAMALRNNTEMNFNLVSGFRNDYKFHRKLELANFNTQLEIASRIHTFDLGYSYLSKIIKKISYKLGFNVLSPRYKIVLEQQHEDNKYHFEYKILKKALGDVYLDGYWQSPKYFEDFADEIRNDFQIRVPIDIKIKEELKYWKSFNRPLVFIGVRMYQECKPEYMPEVCPAKYYNDAIDIMKEKLNDPLFIVFSQAHEWCINNINMKDVIFATPKNGELSSIEDLYLMSNCDHAIISNSSFYWWGAWLQKKNNVVIAPTIFHNADQLCDNWIAKAIN